MEVASDASAWLVVLAIKLVRVIILADSLRRSEAKFGRVGCCEKASRYHK